LGGMKSTLLLPALMGAATLAAQAPQAPAPRGHETIALPVLNFNSDEGVGYGALLQVYDYGAGVRPYRYTIQPTLEFTTKGRRDFTVFFDAPSVMGSGWRLDAFLGREQELAAPYYGLGNDAVHDKALEDDPNPHYYRYGRQRERLAANVQRRLGSSKLRVLGGLGFAHVTTDATPFDSGTTLFAQDFPNQPGGSHFSGRGGLVYDSRDREIGPHSGWWSEVLAQAVSGSGGSSAYSRVTATARRYTPITQRLTGASRFLVQQASGDVPIYDLATVQSSYQGDEGLGGSKNLRGIPKNRVMGKGLVLLNNELRWRVTDFRLIRRSAFLMLSGFVDAGRVWDQSIRVGELTKDLWMGYGGGVRLGLGESSVIAMDIGHSSSATQLYLGLGYAY
jgi:outer membrane protein assembly factor BamA